MKKKITVIVILVLLCTLIISYFTPCSLENILAIEISDINEIECYSSVTTIKNGEPDIKQQGKISFSKDDNDFETITKNLSEYKYRRDIRNIISFLLSDVEGKGDKTVFINLKYNNNKSNYFSIGNDGTVIMFDITEKGFKIYHTKSELADKLLKIMEKVS